MTTKTIAQIKFDQIAKASFWNVLRPRGFKRQAYAFFCQRDGFAQVVDLQRYVPGEPGSVHFTINVGLYFPEYKKAKRANQEVPRFPKSYDCAVRPRIGELMNARDTWFDIDAGSNDEAVVTQMNGLLADYILPFLDRYSEKDTILDDLPNLALPNAFTPLILEADAALILLAENGRMEKARGQYEQMLGKYQKNPDWVLAIGKRYGFNVEPEPGEVLKRGDRAGSQEHPLKKSLDKILTLPRHTVARGNSG